jgi:hypothetical protein
MYTLHSSFSLLLFVQLCIIFTTAVKGENATCASNSRFILSSGERCAKNGKGKEEEEVKFEAV